MCNNIILFSILLYSKDELYLTVFWSVYINKAFYLLCYLLMFLKFIFVFHIIPIFRSLYFHIFTFLLILKLDFRNFY